MTKTNLLIVAQKFISLSEAACRHGGIYMTASGSSSYHAMMIIAKRFGVTASTVLDTVERLLADRGEFGVEDFWLDICDAGLDGRWSLDVVAKAAIRL